MSHEIQIYLNNYDNRYFPGQVVNGRVECNFSTERKIKAIIISFEGKCVTSWSVKEKQNDAVGDVRYSGEEIYFNHEYNLMGSGHSEFKLPAGRHLYPFCYHLPEKVPSSFEDEFGWATVQYQIKAKIDSPSKTGVEACTALNVTSLLDLNRVTDIDKPIDVWAETTLRTWMCRKRAKITLSLTSPVRGYIAGEDITIKASIQNVGAGIKKLKLKLIQLTEFIVQTPKNAVKQSEIVMAETSISGASTNGEKTWTITLSIPSDNPFPNMISSNLINIKHHVKGEVEIRGKRSNLKAFLPIAIGHIPIQEISVVRTLPSTIASAPISNSFMNEANESAQPVPPPYNEVIELQKLNFN